MRYFLLYMIYFNINAFVNPNDMERSYDKTVIKSCEEYEKKKANLFYLGYAFISKSSKVNFETEQGHVEKDKHEKFALKTDGTFYEYVEGLKYWHTAKLSGNYSNCIDDGLTLKYNNKFASAYEGGNNYVKLSDIFFYKKRDPHQFEEKSFYQIAHCSDFIRGNHQIYYFLANDIYYATGNHINDTLLSYQDGLYLGWYFNINFDEIGVYHLADCRNDSLIFNTKKNSSLAFHLNQINFVNPQPKESFTFEKPSFRSRDALSTEEIKKMVLLEKKILTCIDFDDNVDTKIGFGFYNSRTLYRVTGNSKFLFKQMTDDSTNFEPFDLQNFWVFDTCSDNILLFKDFFNVNGISFSIALKNISIFIPEKESPLDINKEGIEMQTLKHK